jgi:CRP/FNR family transcriptional regulator, cyclic AMP receptor protein
VRRVSGTGDPHLKGLKNLSWLRASQLSQLTKALSISCVEKHGIIFNEKSSLDTTYILLSGLARITRRDRKGSRGVLIVLAPGMIPPFPPPVVGINYDFRCEATTDCQVGAVGGELFVRICLGVRAAADFKQLVANYVGRWNAVHLRCSNFMDCTLAERLALLLLELSDNFGVRDAAGMRLAVPARHKDLAELLAASRPRVSEHLFAFEYEGLVIRRNRQLIVKRDRLEEFLLQTHFSSRDH